MAKDKMFSNYKTSLQNFITLVQKNWILELIVNSSGLALSSIIAIIPSVYWGSPDWLKTIYLWTAITIAIFFLGKITLYFSTKKFFHFEEKAKPVVSLKFFLQRLVTIILTLLVMVSSGIVGTRCFGQRLVSQSCLACQVVKGNYKSAVWLIVIGASLNNSDEFGQSALVHAVSKKQDWLIKFLLFSGASSNFKEKNSITTPLIIAVHQGNLDRIKLLLKYNADPNLAASTVSPLRVALKNNRLDIATMLIENGADPNSKDFLGMTSLLYESKVGNLNAVNFLLNNKANVNLTNSKNETPLYLAVLNEKKDVVESLLKNGALLDIAASKNKSFDKETPLMAAIRLNNFEIKEMLLKASSIK